jgi:DUF4097 and DUF4098 domain-containing protein YvlB
MYEFPIDRPITAAIRVHAGGAKIIAEERETVSVDVQPEDGSSTSREAAERTQVEMRGDTLVVEPPESPGGWLWRRGGRIRVTARVPLDSTLHLRVASADADVQGRWREARIQAASGDVALEHVTGDVNVTTASGDLRVNRIDGDARAQTASGDLSLGWVGGEVTLHTASGDIDVTDVGGSATARSASGDVTLAQTHRGQVRIQTASGDVRVGVVQGTRVYLDVNTMSGSTRSDLSLGEAPGAGKDATDLSVYVRTASGDVEVTRAHVKTAA